MEASKCPREVNKDQNLSQKKSLMKTGIEYLLEKKTPKHGRTLVHKDKTKVIPRKKKNDRDYE